jgi:TatD DNase family protein
MPEALFTDSKGREVPTPDLGGPVADTHAHLDMLEDPGLALANAARANVRFIATVADPSEDARRTYDDLPAWFARAREALDLAGMSETSLPLVRTIVGVHPHNAKNLDAEVEGELRRLARHALTSAIGEIGLDYHYDYSPREIQREAFRRQLHIAHELNLPAVVHLREAHDDGEAILREIGLPEAGCVLHCYNLGPQPLDRFLTLGCAVSFAGPATFKKAEEVREAATMVPLERILTETDCPFMAPEPFRGIKNEPAYTLFTAARLAEARGEEPAQFSAAAYANAIRILDRPRA